MNNSRHPFTLKKYVTAWEPWFFIPLLYSSFLRLVCNLIISPFIPGSQSEAKWSEASEAKWSEASEASEAKQSEASEQALKKIKVQCSKYSTWIKLIIFNFFIFLKSFIPIIFLHSHHFSSFLVLSKAKQPNTLLSLIWS